MKRQEGITLLSLVTYIAVAMIVIGIMAIISSYFYKNISWVKDREKNAQEFNKFNMFFIGDIKANRDATVSGTQIKFSDGTIYRYEKEKGIIYRNNTIVAENIAALLFSKASETTKGTNTTKNIIRVDMILGRKNTVRRQVDYTLKYR